MRTICLMALFLVGCKSLKDSEAGSNATLRDYTGLDGCKWVIELEKADRDGMKLLEPTNLDSFNIKKKEGLKVVVTYQEAKGYSSVCMVGRIVWVSQLRAR